MAEEIEEQGEAETQTGTAPGVGAQLRAAREAKGISVEQLAAETRIPQRHLKTIEEGQFSDLPGRTYAMGFAKTYAKVVDLNQDDVAEMVRAELDAQQPEDHYRPKSFEPGDPARAPSRTLFWVTLAGFVILLIGLVAFFRTFFFPGAELPSLVEQEQAEQRQAQIAAQAAAERQPEPAPTSGPVVFTALDDEVWVRFYDDSGRLMESILAEGDSYTVPADAQNPMIWTGRPEALGITIGGQTVPKLAEEQTTMQDVPITAEALLAREEAPGTSSGASPAEPAT